jgi:tetratricopeptide (TPR) repeat protein
MKRLILLVCASVMLPAIAAAQPNTPDGWYQEGETKYNLGDFQGAVDAFKKGFELETNESKRAAYLFNVAQAYRMGKDCYQAQFFYKRYLALKENDTRKPLKEDKRKEIEGLIRELDECAKQQESIRNQPPDKDPDTTGDKDPGEGDKGEGDKGTKVVADTGEGEGEGEGDGVGIVKGTDTGAPKLVSVRAFGGGAKLSTGDLDVPVQATFGLIAGYPLAINDKVILELGAGFTFTPVPFEDSMGTSKSAKLIAAFANAGVTYQVASKVGLRGDLGLGAQFFSGVSVSPFTDDRETSGALGMFHLRVGASVDFAVTPNFIVTATPIAFSYSPAPKGLEESITAITAIDFMVGLGYRM